MTEIDPTSGTFSPLRPGELLADRAAMAPPTSLLPGAVPALGWRHVLHDHGPLRLALALRRERGAVITNLPFHLPPC